MTCNYLPVQGGPGGHNRWSRQHAARETDEHGGTPESQGQSKDGEPEPEPEPELEPEPEPELEPEPEPEPEPGPGPKPKPEPEPDDIFYLRKYLRSTCT